MSMRVIRCSVFAALLCLGSFLQGQTCGGTERWQVKVGADPTASSVDLVPTPISLVDLIRLQQPHLPNDNTTRLSQEDHVYSIQGRLVKFKQEPNDNDYHLVISDDSLQYTDDHAHQPTGHSFIAEIPDPNCIPGQHGDPSAPSRFIDQIRAARAKMDARFPNMNRTGRFNDAAGVAVTIVGVGFFDRPHGQTGRASNNLEIHPIIGIKFADEVPTSPVSTGTATPTASSSQMPSVIISSPADGSHVSGTVNITVAASPRISKLEIYIDGNIVACNVNANSISYPWNTSGLSGSHSVSARAYDAAGNVRVTGPINVTMN